MEGKTVFTEPEQSTEECVITHMDEGTLPGLKRKPPPTDKSTIWN